MPQPDADATAGSSIHQRSESLFAILVQVDAGASYTPHPEPNAAAAAAPQAALVLSALAEPNQPPSPCLSPSPGAPQPTALLPSGLMGTWLHHLPDAGGAATLQGRQRVPDLPNGKCWAQTSRSRSSI